MPLNVMAFRTNSTVYSYLILSYLNRFETVSPERTLDQVVVLSYLFCTQVTQFL